MTCVAETEAPTVTALAEHYDVSRQTIYTWRDKGCPIRAGVEAIDRWLQDHRPDPAKPKGPLQEQLLQAQIEKTIQEARAKQLKNDQTEGLLGNMDDMAQEVAEVLTVLNARLEQIPDEARKELPAEYRDACTARIDELIYLALKECAAKLRSAAKGNAA
jgi:phage terminase Nu1 subunit (DNA packaging protein)